MKGLPRLVGKPYVSDLQIRYAFNSADVSTQNTQVFARGFPPLVLIADRHHGLKRLRKRIRGR